MIFSQISFGNSVLVFESILSLLLIGSISESSFGLFSPLGNSLRFLVKFCRFSWKFHDLDETGYFLHNFTKFFSVALKIRILFLNTKVCRCYQNVEIIELGSCSVDQVTPIMVKDVVKSKFFLPWLKMVSMISIVVVVAILWKRIIYFLWRLQFYE